MNFYRQGLFFIFHSFENRNFNRYKILSKKTLLVAVSSLQNLFGVFHQIKSNIFPMRRFDKTSQE